MVLNLRLSFWAGMQTKIQFTNMFLLKQMKTHHLQIVRTQTKALCGGIEDISKIKIYAQKGQAFLKIVILGICKGDFATHKYNICYATLASQNPNYVCRINGRSTHNRLLSHPRRSL